jgi:hypothetical protein
MSLRLQFARGPGRDAAPLEEYLSHADISGMESCWTNPIEARRLI